MFREIFRKALKTAKETFGGRVEMQELLNRKNVSMLKTKEYEADDHKGYLVWSYRFKFDNGARKRQFLQAIQEYPAQDWDDWVDWFDDISNLHGEICVEARCMVPPESAGKMRYQFEHFVTKVLTIKD